MCSALWLQNCCVDLQIKHSFSVGWWDGVWQLRGVSDLFKYQIRESERTREFGVKSIWWTSPGLSSWCRGLWIGKGESFGVSTVLVRVWCSCLRLGVNLALISRVVYGWIQDMQPPWFRSVPESWNHTQDLSVSGRKVYFYSKHPAVIQKYGILAECHLFIKTQKTLGPLVAFFKLLGTAGAQLCTWNSSNWSAAMATGNTESGLANQWLKMHVWKGYFIVNNCFICWHINASIQIIFFVSLWLGFVCN